MQRLCLEQRHQRLRIGKNIDILASVEAGRFPFAQDDVRPERFHAHFPFAHVQRNISHFERAEIDTEKAQKLVPLHGDPQHALFLVDRHERGKLARKQTVEQLIKIEGNPFRLDGGKLDVLSEKRNGLFRIRFYFDAVQFEIDISVCIRKRKRSFCTAKSERHIPRKRSVRKRDIQRSRHADALAADLALVSDLRMQRLCLEQRHQRLNMRQQFGIIRLFRLGKRPRCLVTVAKRKRKRDAVIFQFRGNVPERRMPFLIEQERKLHGKRNRAERKLRGKRSARFIVEKLPFPEPCKQRIEPAFREGQRTQDLFEGKLSADAAVLQVRLSLIKPQLQDTEIGAESDAVERHFADVEIDGAL